MKKLFVRNIGNLDRIFRIVVGIMLIIIGVIFTEGSSMIIISIIGLILLVSGITGICPTYSLIGISTKRKIRDSENGIL